MNACRSAQRQVCAMVSRLRVGKNTWMRHTQSRRKKVRSKTRMRCSLSGSQSKKKEKSLEIFRTVASHTQQEQYARGERRERAAMEKKTKKSQARKGSRGLGDRVWLSKKGDKSVRCPESVSSSLQSFF